MRMQEWLARASSVRMDAALARARSARESPGAGADGFAELLGARLPAQETRYVVQKGDTLWGIGVRKLHVDPKQLARDNAIANPDRIVPGQVLVVRRPADEGEKRVVASWYGPGFDHRPMANGDPYDRHALTVAHKTLPLGTQVELKNPRTGERVLATVTDRGPFVAGRDVDLSFEVARRLDVLEPGVAPLVMRVVG